MRVVHVLVEDVGWELDELERWVIGIGTGLKDVDGRSGNAFLQTMIPTIANRIIRSRSYRAYGLL